MKTKLMSFNVDVPADIKAGDIIRHHLSGQPCTFECVECDGELVLKLIRFNGEKVLE